MIEVEIYNVDHTTGTFTKKADITTFKNLEWVEELNGFGSAYFGLNAYDDKGVGENLKRYRSVVAIKENGFYYFVGFVSSIGGGLRGIEGTVDVEVLGYLANLKNRYTDAIQQYKDTDAGSIVIGSSDSLINKTQAKAHGHLGISAGTIETTVNRDRTYEYKNIAEAIKDLTQVINGFDFDLSYTTDSDGDLSGVKLNIYQNKGVNRGIVFTHSNVQAVDFRTTDDIRNYVTGIGAGTGEHVIIKTTEDSASEEGYGRQEYILSRKDISIEDTLKEHVDRIVRDHKVDRYNMIIEPIGGKVAPILGSINVGDWVSLDYEVAGFFDFHGSGRVLERSVRIEKEGRKRVRYKLAYED